MTRLQSRDVCAVSPHRGGRSGHRLRRITTNSTGSNAVVVMTLTMVNGRGCKHLAQHFFLQFSIDCCDAPATMVPHWRSLRAARAIVLHALIPLVVLRRERAAAAEPRIWRSRPRRDAK